MAKTTRKSQKSNGEMVPDCLCCKGWVDDTRGRVGRCRFTDGTTHAAPEYWIACRSDRWERNGGLGPVEALRQAWCDWAEQCAMEIKFNREQEVAA